MAVRNPTQYPPRPILEGTERGFVRFESNTATLTELPQLKLQAPETTDRGLVRFGSSNITSAR